MEGFGAAGGLVTKQKVIRSQTVRPSRPGVIPDPLMLAIKQYDDVSCYATPDDLLRLVRNPRYGKTINDAIYSYDTFTSFLLCIGLYGELNAALVLVLTE